jgi:hypothetical protein
LKKPHGYKVGGKKEIHTSKRQRFTEEVEETAWVQNVEKERYIKTAWIQNLGKERCTETAWIQNARKERYTETAWIGNTRKERYIYIPQGGRDLQKKVKKPHGYNMQGKER